MGHFLEAMVGRSQHKKATRFSNVLARRVLQKQGIKRTSRSQCIGALAMWHGGAMEAATRSLQCP